LNGFSKNYVFTLVVVVSVCVEFFRGGLYFGLFLVFNLFFMVPLVVVVEYFPLILVGYFGGFFYLWK